LPRPVSLSQCRLAAAGDRPPGSAAGRGRAACERDGQVKAVPAGRGERVLGAVISRDLQPRICAGRPRRKAGPAVGARA
jgi:hypothetical protein